MSFSCLQPAKFHGELWACLHEGHCGLWDCVRILQAFTTQSHFCRIAVVVADPCNSTVYSFHLYLSLCGCSESMGPKAEEEADQKSQKEDPAKLKKTGDDPQIQGYQWTYTSVPSL